MSPKERVNCRCTLTYSISPAQAVESQEAEKIKKKKLAAEKKKTAAVAKKLADAQKLELAKAAKLLEEKAIKLKQEAAEKVKELEIIKLAAEKKALKAAKAKARRVAKKKAAEEAVEEVVEEVEPGQIFPDKKHQELYESKKKDYLKFLTEMKGNKAVKKQLLVDKVMEDYPEIFKDMKMWQHDTNFTRPMAFRVKLSQMEGRNLDDLMWKDKNVSKEAAYKMAAGMSDDEMLNLRAFNQAYMEHNKIESVNLVRGTDGRTGIKMSDEIEGDKLDSINIRERTIGGYSDRISIAERFGTRTGGICVQRVVDAKDIIIHKDLLTGVTKRFNSEAEYIILSKKELTIPIKDIKLKNKPFGTDWSE